MIQGAFFKGWELGPAVMPSFGLSVTVGDTNPALPTIRKIPIIPIV